MSVSSKIRDLRFLMKAESINAFILPVCSEFPGATLEKIESNLTWLTGFTGSFALVIIGSDFLYFYTDSRYLIQAERQLISDFEIYDIHKSHPKDLGLEAIHYDPCLHYISEIDSYKSKMVPVHVNPVDALRKLPGKTLHGKLIEYPIGESSKEKCKRCAIEDSFFITDPTCISWLLNLRYLGVNYTPFLPCYAILHPNGALDVFCGLELDIYDRPHVNLMNLSKLEDVLINSPEVRFDILKTRCKFAPFLNPKNSIKDPIVLHKACNNTQEIDCCIEAHIEDGVAITNFMFWLYNSSFTEKSASDKLLSLRRESDKFYGCSFNTISAFGPNAAVVHYDGASDDIIKDGLYLVDSGGQYFGATTDITRTIPIGKVSFEHKRMYTLVLKGHIGLAKAVFPKGTTGAKLDVLARIYLWQENLNYAHSTGHGVGNCLDVHEGPQSMSANNPLLPGMILSNEPGFYKKDHYGIRIENLMIVEENSNGFLFFKMLTMAPINTDLVLGSMLTKEEGVWLYEYNLRVYKAIYNRLSPEVVNWYQSNILA